jgi:hypothetical protein
VQEPRSHPQAAPAQSNKEHRGGKKRRDGGGAGIINQKASAGSTSGLLTADKIKREHELELRRKRNQVSFDKLTNDTNSEIVPLILIYHLAEGRGHTDVLGRFAGTAETEEISYAAAASGHPA